MPLLALDGGEILGERTLADDLRGHLLMSLLGQLPYDGVNVGLVEASRWLDIDMLSAGTRVPWISANALIRAGGPPLPAYRVFDLDGLRVAVIGLTGTPDPDQESLFAPVVPALERTLREIDGLPEPVDRLVVIGALPLTRLMRIAVEHPRIDVALSGDGTQKTPRKPMRLGSTIAAFAGTRGEYLIDLRLDLSDEQARPAHYRLVPLDRHVPGHPHWEQRLAETKSRIRQSEIQRARILPAPASPSPYAGSDACAACHAEDDGIWRASAHARAFRTLVDSGDDFDPQCGGCHVTGWKQPGGFLDAVRTPELAQVHCEACHGPGAAHASEPGPGYGAVSDLETLCVACHDSVQDPQFDFRAAWNDIAH